MNRQKGTAPTFADRVDALRQEIIDDIAAILKQHGRQTLNLQPGGGDAVYVAAYNDAGEPFDCMVTQVSISSHTRSGGHTVNCIALEVEDNDGRFQGTLSGFAVGCRNLDYLCEIRRSILAILNPLRPDTRP